MRPIEPSLSSALLRRREAITLIGGAGAGAAWWATHGAAALAQARASTLASAAAQCIALTPEVTPGPYYVPNHLTRRNITDGQRGLALALRLTVEDHLSCLPISGADVELWHANAHGVYSGFAGAPPASRFLRGHQRTDSAGLAMFDTIYPGWYSGRTPHIHLKVHVGGSVVHTGQLFFADALSNAVYRTAQYASRGRADTTDAADAIYHQAGGSRARLAITSRVGGGSVGAIKMAVRR